MAIYDLLYLEDANKHLAIQEILQDYWPSAKFEDASDFIHQERLSILLSGCDEDDYLLSLLLEDLAPVSLLFNELIMSDPARCTALLEQL
jgi:hypothetical protein